MAENANHQKPATLNQIESEKPSIPRSFNLLEGDIAGTMNGGHYRTIALREAMAGERIATEGAQLYIQLQTPRTPAYQKLKAVCKVYKVPHVRVFKKYYEFKAQNGGASTIKINELPNFSGRVFPMKLYFPDPQGVPEAISIQETTLWRDSFASCYIERVGSGEAINERMGDPFRLAPPKNALGIRGWVAIWNDELRNKEYESARTEYTGETVSDEEWNSYFFDGVNDRDFYTARARRNNSYFTNYRTELQGDDLMPDTSVPNSQYALTYAQFESYFAELRSQAENAQMNPWDVAQKLSGGKKLTEGRVQLIGEREFPINYSAITQNAYNNNEQVEEKYRVMGMQGAYSYTEIDLAFLNGIEIDEDCYIHVVLCITADTVFETGIDRMSINNTWDSRYRPDLKDDKLDVMYECEFGVPYQDNDIEYYQKIVGYKRKYSELFKLPNNINGEVYGRGYYQASPDGSVDLSEQRILPNNTYQFFEFAGQKFQEFDFEGILDKKIWMDYTDVAINKNLAIRQGLHLNSSGIVTQGPNQIVYFGKHYALTDMPISEDAKNNFTKWGEH